MNDPVIFNIQKFSLHDGPGIRTTIFFKGCWLHCPWCANPESQKEKVQIFWDAKKCVACRRCELACPAKAVSFSNGVHRIDENKCVGCSLCVHECPNSALQLEGERLSIEEIIAECEQDRDFYEESGGGITLSGGEPLLQYEAAIELLKRLHELGFHTAIETTGNISSHQFRSIFPYIDLILFDIKSGDARQLEAVTGGDFDLIFSNLKLAVDSGLSVLARTPVIPGFNDTKEEAEKITAVLKKAGITRHQILPFHQFGENKYHKLNLDYAYTDVAAYHPEDLAFWQQVLLDAGIDSFF